MLQGRKKVVTQYFENIRVFKLNIALWETKLSGGDTAQDVVSTADNVGMH